MQLVEILAQDAPPVKIHLYYDSMCPFCKEFVTEQLHPTWTEIKSIMDVEMFPYGNAKYSHIAENGSWAFTCQHGSDECEANKIHACAKDHFKDIDLEMEFVFCLLSKTSPAFAGSTCAAEVGVQWEPLNQCMKNGEGAGLLHDLATQQEQLDPELYFVPWIIINDVSNLSQTEDCKNDLKRVVCEKYNGTPPEPCGGYPYETEKPMMLHLSPEEQD